MALIGELAVNVVARTDKFKRGMKKARKEVDHFAKATKKAQGVIVKSFAAMAAAVGIHKLQSAITDTIDRIDSLAKAATRLGIASDRLAGLRFAGERAGVDARTMDMLLQRMIRRVAEAAEGTGEAQQAIKDIGLEARQLHSMRPDEMFSRIMEATRGIASNGKKMQVAFKFFDSEGAGAFMQMLGQGRGFLGDMHERAQQLGIAITDDVVKPVEQLKDSLTDLKALFEGKFNKIIIEMSPGLQTAVEDLKWLSSTSAVKSAKENNAVTQIFRSITKAYDDYSKTFLDERGIPFGGRTFWTTRGHAMGSEAQGVSKIRRQTPAEMQTEIDARYGLREDAIRNSIRASMVKAFKASEDAKTISNAFKKSKPRNRITTAISAGLESAIGGTNLVDALNAPASAIRAAERKAIGFAIRNPNLFSKPGDRRRPDDQAQYRELNRSLQKGTIEAFTAIRRNLGPDIPKQQLAEAKKTNQHLARMSDKIGQPGAGINIEQAAGGQVG